MGRLGRLAALALAAAPFFGTSSAQTPERYTDAASGITFNRYALGFQDPPVMSFGYALPQNAATVDSTEFIGILECTTKEAAKGWCGMSFKGGMTDALLLMAWPHEGEILTSFRYGTSYTMPGVYAGDAKLTQVSSTITDTKFTLIFRCENCLKWNHNGATGQAPTTGSVLVLGWAQAFATPENPSCPAQVNLGNQHENQGISGFQVDGAPAASYSAWAAKATKTVTGTCSGPTTSSIASVPVPTGATYDYVIVGAGAGGIPMADKLSEAGKKVLLIEKGPPSTGRWGGKLGPAWLEGTNLTRFDVPGLCNQIWVDSAGIACTDTDQMAGCVLGGGTAVNAGLWWKPYNKDWDVNFPAGWKASDMEAATKRVFSRIPGTDTPSQDGKRYLQQGFEALASGFKAAGWTSVTANNDPNAKNRTYSHSPFMFSKGERGGPLATYLVSASGRKNFNLWMNTAVNRIVRTGGHATGIEVEAFRNGGYQGTVQLTPVTGRVIVAAGAFGSAKLLMRSGIGPADQLAVVKGSRDGPTMIQETDWINLPVGSNLVDHLNTDTVIEHPAVEFYDFYQAWTDPNPGDKNAYLGKRSGILAQAAPNIGPIFWDEIKGADGNVRQMQWTARVEGSLGAPNGKTMTLSQYLGRGQTSRGRMTITNDLNTIVSTVPYLRDEHDKAAVIQGIKNVQAALSKATNLKWVFPPANMTVEQFVNDMVVSTANRRANHWMGTNKMGTDDGRRTRGTAVVDTNARVWGTDNVFVVDASIFPGMITTNPTAYIIIASERAAERILALPANKGQPKYQQCAGKEFNGPFMCEASLKCQYQNDYYSQCL